MFEETCAKYSYIGSIAQKKFKIKNHEFIGMNWVNDLPFGLKDRCRKDTKDFEFPKQLGKQVLSTPNKLKKIDDWFSYADTLPTIEDKLSCLVKLSNMENAIYIIHTPPSNLKLDVCNDDREVGSRAVYSFLNENQPLLSCHGHIHESPGVSGNWKSKLGNTTCIQPRQSPYHKESLIYSMIDLERMDFQRCQAKKE